MSGSCQEFRDLLVGESIHELEANEQRALSGHLADCPACRELQESLREEDRELASFVVASESILPRLEDRIRTKVAVTTPEPRSRRWSPPIGLRWAAAAAVIVSIFFGINLFDGDSGPGIVWADVMAKVEKAQDFICRRVEKRTGESAIEMLEYRSARFGLRQEIYRDGKHQASQYIIPGERMLYALIHRDKTFMRQRMTEEAIEEFRRQTNAREIVASFRDHEHRSLGRRRIEGSMAEGIEITDPAQWEAVFEGGVWRLWVDVETQWPVRLELEGTIRAGKIRKTYLLKDFQWNPSLSASDFEVDVPRDYRLIADLAAVEATEEKTISALRAYARLVGARYPSRLALATAIAEAEEILDARHDKYDEAAGEDLQALFTIRDACEFFSGLETGGRDPAWYGDSVRALDFDRVLMRWRLEDGQYRVIYGDLRAETVSAERLAELER